MSTQPRSPQAAGSQPAPRSRLFPSRSETEAITMPLQSHPEGPEGPGETQAEWRRQEESGTPPCTAREPST